MLTRLAIYSYRSLRDFVVPLEPLNRTQEPISERLDRSGWHWRAR